MPTIELRLDVAKPQSSIPIVHVRQGDTATTIRAIITDNGAPYDFSSKYLELAFVRPDGAWIHLKDACSQVEGNTWDCTLPLPATGKAGLADLCYFVVRNSEDMQFHDSTNRFFMDFDPSATTDIDQAPYSDQLDALIRQATMLTDTWERQIKAQADEFTANEKARETQFRKLLSQMDALFKAAETERRKTFQQQEQARQTFFESAEEARDLAQSKNNADQAANNEAARGMIGVVLTEGQYDPETHAPTIPASEANFYTVYSIPKESNDPTDKYEEWHVLSIDGVATWEKYNSPSVVHPEPVPTDKVDQIVAGQGATGEETVDTNVLAYYDKKRHSKEAMAQLFRDNADALRDAIGLVTKEHMGLVPPLPRIAEAGGLLTLEESTWEEIADATEYAASDPDRYAEYLLTEKTVSLGTFGDNSIVLIGAGQDAMTSGGKAGFTFMLKTPIGPHRMKDSDTTTGGWGATELKTWLETDVLPQFPEELRKLIVPVDKTSFTKVTAKSSPTTSAATGATPETTSDKLWIMSTSELGTKTNYPSDGENQYPIVTGEGDTYQAFASATRSTYIKTVGEQPVPWWTRSISVQSTAKDDTDFRIVNPEGDMGCSGAEKNGGAPASSEDIYVVPCFAIMKGAE